MTWVMEDKRFKAFIGSYKKNPKIQKNLMNLSKFEKRDSKTFRMMPKIEYRALVHGLNFFPFNFFFFMEIVTT